MHLSRWKRGPENAPVVWDPWNEMDRLFQRVWLTPLTGDGGQAAPTMGVPVALDMCEDEQSVCVRAEVPGIAPEDLDITVQGDVLTISGEKQEQQSDEKQGYHRTERRFGRFQRSIQLPGTVDTNAIEATHENGVVTITLKKAASALPRKVEVKKSQRSAGAEKPGKNG